MIGLIADFARNQNGATLVEYAVIASLICVAVIAGALAVGQQLGVTYTGVAGKLK